MALAGKECPLCGGPGTPYDKDRALRFCPCGTLLSWQWPDEATYRAWYEGTYHFAGQTEGGQKVSPQRDVDHLRASLARLETMHALGYRRARLLDVGAGVGSFVAGAIAAGWEASGIELCPTMVEQAILMGRPVIRGGWEDLAELMGEPPRFEVSTVHDVLEHLTAPLSALREIRKVLVPGGTIVVEMPEFCSQFGDWERHIRPLQHVCLYTESAARSIICRAGFSIRHVTRPCGPDGRPLGKAVYWGQKDG